MYLIMVGSDRESAHDSGKMHACIEGRNGELSEPTSDDGTQCRAISSPLCGA